jgi:hypothetical protein
MWGIGLVLLLAGRGLSAQTFPTEDQVIKQMWQEGMENSHAYRLAQALLDSLGPRLSGSPGHRAANEWAVAKLRSWGIDARNEQYGTWRNWRRGINHVDLVEPRVRSLEATMLAWSPGTDGKVRGGLTILPDVESEEAFEQWLPQVRGKFVLTSYAEPTCRPDANWEEFATTASFERLKAERAEARRAWRTRIENTGNPRELAQRLEAAGAIGILGSNWSSGWGVTRIFSASTKLAPTFALSCEDYGLVYRLAENNQGPVIEVEADAEFMGEQPIFNTIGEIRGGEKSDEYVVLSAHYDSWDGASGATDNGTGSITMLEAMRILKASYPNPTRTIIMGLWGGEEQGLIGSRAFVEDHPEVIEGLQAAFNQDNGTGRVVNIAMQGFVGAGAHFGRWLSYIPREITQHIDLNIPGRPGGGGSDYASFVCGDAPAFNLSALNWDYFRYTWHTNRDTFDKVVMDDLKNNATLTAMLVYLASEDPERIPRDHIVLPVSQRTGEQMTWPECRPARRSSEAGQ